MVLGVSGSISSPTFDYSPVMCEKGESDRGGVFGSISTFDQWITSVS